MLDEPSSEPLGVLVGHAIGVRRRALGLTLSALATHVGVSQPFLSQIERGISMPSMTTIYGLARALEVAPGDLLPPPTPRPDIVRAGEGQRLAITEASEDLGIRALLLADNLPLTVLEYTISPNEKIMDWYQTAGESGLFVLEGTLDVAIQEGPTFTLEPNDFLHLPSATRERWSLASPETARVLFMISVPATAGRASGRGLTRARIIDRLPENSYRP